MRRDYRFGGSPNIIDLYLCERELWALANIDPYFFNLNEYRIEGAACTSGLFEKNFDDPFKGVFGDGYFGTRKAMAKIFDRILASRWANVRDVLILIYTQMLNRACNRCFSNFEELPDSYKKLADPREIRDLAGVKLRDAPLDYYCQIIKSVIAAITLIGNEDGTARLTEHLKLLKDGVLGTRRLTADEFLQYLVLPEDLGREPYASRINKVVAEAEMRLRMLGASLFPPVAPAGEKMTSQHIVDTGV